MITTNSSGLPISQAFVDAVSAPVVGYSMRVFSGGADTGWNVMRATIDLGAGGSSDAGTEDLAIGGTYSSQVTLVIGGTPTGVPGTELEIRVGVDVGSSYEWVTVAHVTATSSREWMGQTTIKATGPVASKMWARAGLSAGSATPSEVIAAIASASGVTVTLGPFSTTSTTVSVNTSMTCREALSALATRLGGYAAESNDGTVIVAPFSSSSTFALSEDVVPSRPDLAGSAYVCDGLTVETSEGALTFGTGRARVDDPYGDSSTASAIWTNVQGYTFTPGTIPVAVADPRVTPFDVASFSLAGHVGSLPTQGISLTYDGGLFGTYWAAGLTAEEADELVQGNVGRTASEAMTAAAGAMTAAQDALDDAEEALSVAQAAQEAADATGQHFWTDTQGAHVTQVTREEWEDSGGATYHSGPNALLNSLGLLFRNGLRTLMSVLPAGVAIFDGQGDSEGNVVAEFAADHARIGSAGTSNVLLSPDSLTMTDGSGLTLLDVERRPGNGTVHQVTETFQVLMTMADRLSGTSVTLSATPDSTSTVNVYVNGTICYETVWDPDRLVMVPHFTDVSGGYGFYGHGTSGTGGFYNYKPDNSYLQTITLEYDGSRTIDMSATMSGPTFQPTATWLPVSTVTVTYGVAGDAPSLTFGTRTPSAGVGLYSSTFGEALTASQPDQMVLGRYNVEDTQGDYALLVGNGTDDSSRSNALAVAWNGDLSCGLVNGVDVTQISGGVTGVKGNSETSYRTGNVNLTAANIGAQAALSVESGTNTRTTANCSSMGTNSCRRYGKVVVVSFNGLTLAASLASGSTSGTLVTVPSGYRPAAAIRVPFGSSGNNVGYANITTGGLVTVRNSGSSAIATSTQLSFQFTYIIA